MHTFSFKYLRESYLSRLEPERYVVAAEGIWILILIAAMCIALASIGYGIFQFVSPPDAVVSEVSTGGITGFNRAQLSQVVEFYGKRQATFETMMSAE